MKNWQSSVKTNFIMNAILKISPCIFSFMTFPYVSRILSPEGIGKVSFATSLITYFAMLAQLGIPIYGIRACATIRDDKIKLSRTVHELFTINLLMSVLAYIFLFASLLLIPELQGEKTLYFIVSFTIIFNAMGMEWLYQALEQYKYITLRSVTFKLLAAIAMFIFINKQSDYVIYGGICIFAASASNILNFINVRRYISLKPVGNYNLSKHFKAVLVFFSMSCATVIYTNLDSVMLGFLATNEDVGYYDVAVKIRTVLLSIITALGAVLLPRAAYYIEKNMKDKFYRISEKAINFIFVTAVPVTVYFILFAKESIFLLSGEEYNGSVLPMQVIMPTVFFIGLTNIMGIQMLIPLKKEKIVLYSEIAGAIIDLIINFTLIPKMQSVGAAIGTLAAEIAVFAVLYFYLRKEVKKAYKNISYLKIILATTAASILSILVKFLNLDLFFTLFLSAILFFVGYGIVLLLCKETLVTELTEQIKQKLKRH